MSWDPVSVMWDAFPPQGEHVSAAGKMPSPAADMTTMSTHEDACTSSECRAMAKMPAQSTTTRSLRQGESGRLLGPCISASPVHAWMIIY